MGAVFIHGLDSSSRGTKARWFKRHFPAMQIPDFSGGLRKRMDKLKTFLAEDTGLTLIGSSYGGLMATLYAQENNSRVIRVILLAPALNFFDFSGQVKRVNVPAELFIGRQDTVCPPKKVIPVAEQVYANLSVHITDDDHLLRDTFMTINWHELLGQ